MAIYRVQRLYSALSDSIKTIGKSTIIGAGLGSTGMAGAVGSKGDLKGAAIAGGILGGIAGLGIGSARAINKYKQDSDRNRKIISRKLLETESTNRLNSWKKKFPDIYRKIETVVKEDNKNGIYPILSPHQISSIIGSGEKYDSDVIPLAFGGDHCALIYNAKTKKYGIQDWECGIEYPQGYSPEKFIKDNKHI